MHVMKCYSNLNNRTLFFFSNIEKHTCGCISAATMKTPATKQKNTVVTEQNCDSTPSFINPIRTTIITRLYIVEMIPASISLKYKYT